MSLGVPLKPHASCPWCWRSPLWHSFRAGVAAGSDQRRGDRGDNPFAEKQRSSRLGPIRASCACRSPGVIDGYDRENVRKAIAAFETMPVVQPHPISKDDAAGLVSTFLTIIRNRLRMDHLGYTSVAERLAERFHIDLDLLKAFIRSLASYSFDRSGAVGSKPTSQSFGGSVAPGGPR